MYYCKKCEKNHKKTSKIGKKHLKYSKKKKKSKKLYRSRTNKTIAGICGGMGEYFDMDPTLIRIIWILFLLLGGSGLLLYLILWILIPKEPKN